LLPRLLLLVFDVLAAGLALATSIEVTQRLNPTVFPAGIPEWTALLSANPHLPAGWMLIAVWLIMLRWSGGYTPRKMTSPLRMVTMTFRSSGGVLIFIAALHLGLRDIDWSRWMVASYLTSSTLQIVLLRLVFFTLMPRIASHRNQQAVAIVGVGGRAEALTRRLEEYGHQAFRLAGYLSPPSEAESVEVNGEVLGSVMDLPDLISAHPIDVLILASEQLDRSEHLNLANQAEALGIHLLQMPKTWGIANPKMSLADLGDLQLVDLTTLAYPTEAEQLKRALDLVLVGLGGLLLLPLLMIIGLLIRFSDGGPALYTQARSGRGGRRFEMYKFRSMVVGADQLRAELKNENEAEGVLFKMREDPRVTPIGRWIRRWSLDELPQLLNVLRGDMNLVGPRPLPIDDLRDLNTNTELRYWFTQRSKVKPGITGTWQISTRDSLKMEDMVRLDIDYIQNWNILLDLVLLLKTVPAVLRGRGAH